MPHKQDGFSLVVERIVTEGLVSGGAAPRGVYQHQHRVCQPRGPPPDIS